MSRRPRGSPLFPYTRLSRRVAVFGIGGVGGYTVEALVRSGVGTVDLIDDDKVCLTNINRQIYATRKTVGKYKVDVAAERIHEINPDAVVNTYKTFYQPETEAATADQIVPMVKADLGIGFVPEEFLEGIEGVSVIETEDPLPEREIRVVKRCEQPLGIAAKEMEKLI